MNNMEQFFSMEASRDQQTWSCDYTQRDEHVAHPSDTSSLRTHIMLRHTVRE